jgi:hypothetical protein
VQTSAAHKIRSSQDRSERDLQKIQAVQQPARATVILFSINLECEPFLQRIGNIQACSFGLLAKAGDNRRHTGSRRHLADVFAFAQEILSRPPTTVGGLLLTAYQVGLSF